MMIRRILLAALLGLATLTSSFAATTPNSIVAPQTPKFGLQSFTSADPANSAKTVYTGGANGSVCNAVALANTTGVVYTVTIQIVRTIGFPLATVSVPASASIAPGTPALSVFTSANTPYLPLDANGNYYVYLQSGDLLQAYYGSPTITGGGSLYVSAVCADF